MISCQFFGHRHVFTLSGQKEKERENTFLQSKKEKQKVRTRDDKEMNKKNAREAYARRHHKGSKIYEHIDRKKAPTSPLHPLHHHPPEEVFLLSSKRITATQRVNRVMEL